MDAYTFTLALGAAGLATMAATGAAHLGSGPAGHGTAHGHAPELHGGHAAGHEAGAHHAGVDGRALLGTLASPRVLFGLLLGFGLTGVIARPFVGGVLLAAIALAGAITLEVGLMQPLWRFFFRFASRPALTLESSLMGEARASTAFNREGQGLVALEVDGQIVQCLATLRADDRELGVRVGAGDRLRVEDVDAQRQQCTVSYVGRADSAR